MYEACRPFCYPGSVARTIGTRKAKLEDIDALAALAQSAYQHLEGGGGRAVYQFCWNEHHDPQLAFKGAIERAINDRFTQVYLLEDASQDHELLAAVIIGSPHDLEDVVDEPQISPGLDNSRWAHYQTELFTMRRALRIHENAHIQDLIINPQYSYMPTRDPQNPEPFLARALFNFIHSSPEEVRNSERITAIVPILTAAWLYRRLGFETVDGDGNKKRVTPPEGSEDPERTYQAEYVDVELMVWRRRL